MKRYQEDELAPTSPLNPRPWRPPWRRFVREIQQQQSRMSQAKEVSRTISATAHPTLVFPMSYRRTTRRFDDYWSDEDDEEWDDYKRFGGVSPYANMPPGWLPPPYPSQSQRYKPSPQCYNAPRQLQPPAQPPKSRTKERRPSDEEAESAWLQATIVRTRQEEQALKERIAMLEHLIETNMARSVLVPSSSKIASSPVDVVEEDESDNSNPTTQMTNQVSVLNLESIIEVSVIEELVTDQIPSQVVGFVEDNEEEESSNSGNCEKEIPLMVHTVFTPKISWTPSGVQTLTDMTPFTATPLVSVPINCVFGVLPTNEFVLKKGRHSNMVDLFLPPAPTRSKRGRFEAKNGRMKRYQEDELATTSPLNPRPWRPPWRRFVREIQKQQSRMSQAKEASRTISATAEEVSAPADPGGDEESASIGFISEISFI